MNLAIDIAENRLSIGARAVAGHHRWEAAVLAVLVEGKHISATSACPAFKLHAALQPLGQSRPLNRKQLSRVWDGVHQMFEQAGQSEALRLRLGHPVRGRTVGPWWWAVQPRDKVQVAGHHAHIERALDMPRLTVVDAATDRCAALCWHVMDCEWLLHDGKHAEAAKALSDGPAWCFAAQELHAFRHLRLAECELQQRNFDKASAALRAGRALIAESEIAAIYLGGAMQLMEHRLAYAKAPTTNYGKISGALVPMLNPAARTHAPEVDRHTRGLALNLAALCERRWLEQHAAKQGAEAAAPHVEAALRYWYAALFGFITTSQHEHTQNMCSNIGYFMHRAFELGLQPGPEAALAWYAVAHTLQNRFYLADNNVWEFIFLGDFWLYQPKVRSAFQTVADRARWAGRSPDNLDFYEFALTRAVEIGEPRQLAHTALNLWHFAREHDQPTAASGARAALHAVFSAHPEVRGILRAEGYPLP